MSYQFDTLIDSSISPISAIGNPADFARRVAQLIDVDAPRFVRLWNYYRNPQQPASTAIDSTSNSSARPYRVAQEWGLPPRITGMRPATNASTLSNQSLLDVSRKEVVVENDIAWRIDAMVDYLFGKPVTIHSPIEDQSRKSAIELILATVLEQHGGPVFMQQLALLGAVHGFVDVLVKLDTQAAATIAHDIAERIASNALQTFTDGAGPSERVLSDVESAAASADASVDSADFAPPPAEPANVLDTFATEPDASSPPAPTGLDDATLIRIARCIRLEIVEPSRALPLLASTNWREVQAYAQVFTIARPATTSTRIAKHVASRTKWISRLFGAVDQPSLNDADSTQVVEIITPTRWARFEDQALVSQGQNSLGELPLVHIQNVALPFEHAGASDLEPLMPLQDELNTRLSDRANRITMQSFKMYLGRGIENFGDMPVAPGRMWMTDNENADVVEFGGDASSPSEEAHIDEIREAMDKTSGVSPVAAGILHDRIGQLTSATALRVTLSALLAKTERKRTTYGAGIQRLCELTLAWLDRAGLFHTTTDERHIDLIWPSPLPDDGSNRLADAEAKLRIGVDRNIVLSELGYGSR